MKSNPSQIRKLSAEACEALSTLVTFNVKEISLGGWVKKLADGIKKDGFLDSYGNAFIRRLLDDGMPIEEIVWIIMPTAAAGTANQGQQVLPLLTLLIARPFKCSIFISRTSIRSIGLRLFDWLNWMMLRRGRNCVRMHWKHVVYPLNHTDSSVASQKIVSSKKLVNNTISNPVTKSLSISYYLQLVALTLILGWCKCRSRSIP